MTHPISVLLFDDDPVLSSATALMLTKRGATVRTAATIAEAIAHVAEAQFDVMVVDLSGPAPLASEIVAALRERATLPDRFVFCVSAPSSRPGGTEIVKPFDFEELVRLVFRPGASRRRTISGVYPRARTNVIPFRRRARPVKAARQRGPRVRGAP